MSKNIQSLRAAFTRVSNLLPRIVGETAVRFFQDNILARGGFLNRGTVEKWKDRKDAAAARQRNRRLLTQSGRLWQSIEIISMTPDTVQVGSEVEYAAVHNRGEQIKAIAKIPEHRRKRRGRTETVRAHTRKMNFKMPKRKFMGKSTNLTQLIMKEIDLTFKNELRK